VDEVACTIVVPLAGATIIVTLQHYLPRIRRMGAICYAFWSSAREMGNEAVGPRAKRLAQGRHQSTMWLTANP